MSKSKFIINGIAKIFEQSLVTYKDLRKMGWNGKIENYVNVIKFELQSFI